MYWHPITGWHAEEGLPPRLVAQRALQASYRERLGRGNDTRAGSAILARYVRNRENARKLAQEHAR